MKVRELLELLEPAVPGAEVVIDDADTGWRLRLKRVTLTHDNGDNPIVVLGGDYGDEIQ